jgi:hypothetical protein
MGIIKWLGAIVALAVAGFVAAVYFGGPDLIYPRVPEPNFGPSSIAFEDTDPGKTIGGTILLGRAQDEKGVDMYMVHWGLEVGAPGVEDDAGKGDHGGLCKGFRDTGHVAMAKPSDPGEVLSLTIPQGTVVPEGAVYLVGHTIYAGRHNLAKCVQAPIVNRID